MTPNNDADPYWETALKSKLQRPYTNTELETIRLRTSFYRRLSHLTIHHLDCGHIYRVKLFGPKERQIMENRDLRKTDEGRCSVCWRSDRQGESAPQDLIDRYQTIMHIPSFVDHDLVRRERNKILLKLGKPEADMDSWEVDIISEIIYDPNREPCIDKLGPEAALIEKAFHEWLY